MRREPVNAAVTAIAYASFCQMNRCVGMHNTNNVGTRSLPRDIARKIVHMYTCVY